MPEQVGRVIRDSHIDLTTYRDPAHSGSLSSASETYLKLFHRECGGVELHADLIDPASAAQASVRLSADQH